MSTLAPPLSIDPAQVPPTSPDERRIGALWRRLLAFAIDGILIGIAVSIIAIPLFEPLSRLGVWGRLVGFLFAAPYYVLFNSKVGGGRTLGKRLLSLEVVDANGSTISVTRSFVRFLVLAIPEFLNKLSLPLSRTPESVVSLIGILIFGLGGATLYLILFNRRTRQGIHDLVAGTYVVEARRNGPVRTEPIWKAHWAIVGTLLAITVVLSVVLYRFVEKSPTFSGMFAVIKGVEQLDGVNNATAQSLTTMVASTNGSRKVGHIYIVIVNLNEAKGGNEAFADRVARLATQADPNVSQHDSLRIVLVRGYDLGIANAWKSDVYEHTPQEWAAR